MTDAEKQVALAEAAKINALRDKFLLAMFAVAVVVGAIVGALTHPYFGMALAIVVFGSFVLQGIKEIPSVPEPHVGLLLYKRRMIPVVLKAGWRFLPFRPWLFDIEELNASKEDFDLDPPMKVRTPDKALMSVEVSLTIRLDSEDPFACMEYVAAKRLAGVKANMDQLVNQATRRTICSEGEGPQTWMEAQGANNELNHSLLKEIVGESITQVSTNFLGKNLPPTWVLMKYFDSPQPNLTESETKKFVSWDAVKTHLEGELTSAELVELKKLVEKRRAEVKAISSSNGKFKKVPFGVFVERIAVGAITLLDEALVKAATMEATAKAEAEARVKKEDLERQAEVLEIEHVARLIDALVKKGVPVERAVEVVQSERPRDKDSVSKVPMEIKVLRIVGDGGSGGSGLAGEGARFGAGMAAGMAAAGSPPPAAAK